MFIPAPLAWKRQDPDKASRRPAARDEPAARPASPRFWPAPGHVAPHRRIYAVGDIHGCMDRLLALHDAIARDLVARPVREAVLVHLGDYVDRGPDSAAVVAYLAAPARQPVGRVVNLMGNHEEMMLAAIASGDAETADFWVRNGGDASLESWGVSPHASPRQWPHLLPRTHILFLCSLLPRFALDDYLFVHAGLRPGIPLEQQKRRDQLWIREPFLSFDGDLGAIVIHGHTPGLTPVERPNRICLDTGAGRGGRLTCAILEGDRIAFLTA